MIQDVRASSCKYSFGLKPGATIFNLNSIPIDVIVLREIQRKNIFKTAISGKNEKGVMHVSFLTGGQK
jgi:hypothetical protein